MIKKRGRPPITKDYPNPLQSPMAHSSMQVQKQGPHSFAKPLMKVGQSSPSPNKRRLSIDHHHNLAGNYEKMGRYRGVLLSTPTKKSSTNGSTPTLPRLRMTAIITRCFLKQGKPFFRVRRLS